MQVNRQIKTNLYYMSKIIDDFKVFQDKNGLTALNPGEQSDNGALFTVEYLLTLMADSTSTVEEKNVEIGRIISLFETIEAKPGLTIRYPGGISYDSMDNTVSLLTFSALNDFGRFASRLEASGQTRMTGPDFTQDAGSNARFWPIANALSLWRGPKNVWNNQNPGLFCNQGWWGRSPAMLGLIKMAQGKFCNPFLWISVLIGQFLGCTSAISNTDARKLTYVVWQFLKNRSLFWELAYKLWCLILMKYYPAGMGTVYSIYYSNINHPIRKHAKPYIE